MVLLSSRGGKFCSVCAAHQSGKFWKRPTAVRARKALRTVERLWGQGLSSGNRELLWWLEKSAGNGELLWGLKQRSQDSEAALRKRLSSENIETALVAGKELSGQWRGLEVCGAVLGLEQGAGNGELFWGLEQSVKDKRSVLKVRDTLWGECNALRASADCWEKELRGAGR